MNRRALPGLRLLLAVAALTALGLCAGAAVSGSARAAGDDANHAGVHHQCTGGMKVSDTATDQECVITAPTGICIQQSDAQEVTQRCTFTQMSPALMGTNLRATAIQTHNPEGGPDGTQDAFQVIEVSQTNLSPGKSDFLDAAQIANQCLGLGDNFEDEDGDWNDEDRDGDRDDDGRCEDGDEEDGDVEEDHEDENGPLFPTTITQSQRATQTIDAYQKTVGSGRDEARALQVQNLHERAANADVVEQDQNLVRRANECGQLATGLVDFLDANACFTILQESNRAKLAQLGQVYHLFQNARNCCETGAGAQDQGDPSEFFGGLEHSFDQRPGMGTPTQVSYQDERLKQRRVNTPLLGWHQFAGPRKDIGLQDDANGRANMTQNVEIHSTGPGVGSQGAFLEIDCSSLGPGGNCRGTQRADTDGEDYFATDSGASIFMLQRCTGGEGGTECFFPGD
jgi:hypothetical protein